MAVADEYTPTTETVIECFLDGAAGEFIEDDVRAWLAEVERAAAARALEGAADALNRPSEGSGYEVWASGAGDWLRARAEAERQERGGQ